MLTGLTARDAEYPSRVRATRDVMHGQCRWPIDNADASDFTLCCEPVVRGSYCACHAERAFAGRERVPLSILAVVGSRGGRSQ